MARLEAGWRPLGSSAAAACGSAGIQLEYSMRLLMTSCGAARDVSDTGAPPCEMVEPDAIAGGRGAQVKNAVTYPVRPRERPSREACGPRGASATSSARA